MPVKLRSRLLRILRSRRFFWFIVTIFVLGSVWIAVSAAYPGVFDENTHFSLIKLYAHQWNPFISIDTNYTDAAGAVSRDPSYLYHYLLSFPYRIIALITKDQMAQVVALRFINIALFGSALFIFRRLLLKTRISAAVVHLTLLLFILLPVVPLLSSEINYDNLVMPLTGLALLWAVRAAAELRKKGTLPVVLTCRLLVLCLFASLVQFEFLPAFAAIVLWLGWLSMRAFRRSRSAFLADIQHFWHKESRLGRLATLLPLLLAIGLFVQMYGLNLVAYHNLTPQCHQVLTTQQCQTDSSWVRNQVALAHKTSVDANPVSFTAGWLYRLFVGVFYTSSGGASQNAWYLSINPLPLLFLSALAGLAFGVILVIRYHRTIFRNYSYLGFLLFVAVLYSGSLWLRNYHDFVRLGIKIAINGRYLLPIALPCLLMIALGYRELLKHQRPHLQLATLMVLFVMFLQGGGALTYITYSNSDWYWHNRLSVRLNTIAQRVVKPLIIIKSPLRSFGRY